MAGFDTGWGTLDKALETGSSLYSNFLNQKTAKSNAAAAQAVADAEAQRASQLDILGRSTTIGGVSVPNWALPLAIGGVIFAWYIKKK